MHSLIQRKLFNLFYPDQKRRLMIFTPPQHFKSTLISQLFIAWLLLTDPTIPLMLLSYSQALAEEHSQRARDIIDNYGPKLLNVHIRKDSKAKSLWHTTENGQLLANSIQGSVSGFPSKGIIIDDPFRGSEDSESPTIREKVYRTFASVVETRLHPNGFIILVQTRWHPDDLAGRLLETEPHLWDVLTLPALADPTPTNPDPLNRLPNQPLLPHLYSLEWYQKRRQQYEERGLSHLWSALYQGSPTADSSSIEFPSTYFPPSIWYDNNQYPPQENIKLKVLALDPSKSKTSKAGDYSAFTLVTLTHDNHRYVQSWLQRVPADQVTDLAVQLLRQYRPHAFVYEATMMQELWGLAIQKACQQQAIPCPIYQFQSQENKLVRIRCYLSPLLHQHLYHFEPTPSNKLLVKQLQEFPTATNDDGPDSLAMSEYILNYLISGKKPTPITLTV